MLMPLGIIMEMAKSQGLGKINSFLITDRLFFSDDKPDDMMLDWQASNVFISSLEF
jgi:hypothetical protein